MYIVDNTTANNHYSVIKKLAHSADEIIIVSPFCFPDFSSFFDMLANIGTIKSLTFMTTLKREESVTKTYSLFSFKEKARQSGIQNSILINDALHGKVYIFKSKGIPIGALVTSTNITDNGLQRNHEWGCCFDDKPQIESIEKTIKRTAKYELTDSMLHEIKQRVDAYVLKHSASKHTVPSGVNIKDIIVSKRFKLNFISRNIRIFIKPIGSLEHPICTGDYSAERTQYFARRPKAVRKNDLLIAYGVGARKIIGIFQVLSDTALHTGDKTSRWPWYVEVNNITPKFSKVWFDKDIYITSFAQEYIDRYELPITNVGSKTLGALRWGVDKIQLARDFGIELLSTVMVVEEEL